MPPKKYKWLKDMATTPKSGKPLLKASWEPKTQNTRFKPAATSSSAQSWRSSRSNKSQRDSLADLETVVEVPQWVQDELHRRQDPFWKPTRVPGESDWQWKQLTLRNLEFHQRLMSTPEGREQKRAWNAFNAQQASPINVLPVPNNYFKQ